LFGITTILFDFFNFLFALSVAGFRCADEVKIAIVPIFTGGIDSESWLLAVTNDGGRCSTYCLMNCEALTLEQQRIRGEERLRWFKYFH
jgi:hypothetical protein